MTALVAGPTRVPFPYGLFSVVPFRVDTADRWLNGVQYETLGDPPDMRGIDFEEACDPSETPLDLSGEGLSIVDGTPFDIYATYECSIVGNTLDLAADVARARLEEGEERFVETALATGAFGQSPNFEDDAEALTVEGGDPSLVDAVGLLEDAMSASYGTQGVFHVSRGTAVLMLKEGVAEKRGQRLYTTLGTPIVAGSGYTFDGLVVTPQFVAYRGVLSVPGDPRVHFDRSDNTISAMALRPYLIGFDSLPIFSMEFSEALGTAEASE